MTKETCSYDKGDLLIWIWTPTVTSFRYESVLYRERVGCVFDEGIGSVLYRVRVGCVFNEEGIRSVLYGERVGCVFKEEHRVCVV